MNAFLIKAPKNLYTPSFCISLLMATPLITLRAVYYQSTQESSILLEFRLCQKHNRGAGAAGVFLYIATKQTHNVEIKKLADAKCDLISGCVQLEWFSGQTAGHSQVGYLTEGLDVSLSPAVLHPTAHFSCTLWPLTCSLQYNPDCKKKLGCCVKHKLNRK